CWPPGSRRGDTTRSSSPPRSASPARCPPCCPPRCRPATSLCWHWVAPLPTKAHSTSAATKPESTRGPTATAPGQQQETADGLMPRHSTLDQPPATAPARPDSPRRLMGSCECHNRAMCVRLSPRLTGPSVVPNRQGPALWDVLPESLLTVRDSHYR